jgi:hypothetical protein
VSIGFSTRSYRHNHGLLDGCTPDCPVFEDLKERIWDRSPSPNGAITFGNNTVHQIKSGLMDGDLDRVIKAAKKRRKMLRGK